MKKYFLLSFLFIAGLFIFSGCENGAEAEGIISDLKEQLVQATVKMDSMANLTTTPGFAHVVHFWLKEGVTEEQKKGFEAGLMKLGTCPTIGSFYWGTPAASEREVVDDSFDYAWIVFFEDAAAEKAYQVEPIHKEFVELYQDLWAKVVVMDNFINGPMQ